MDTPDPVSTLLKLRADILRLANEVLGLADCSRISSVRAMAPRLAHRMRDAAMADDAVKASERT